MKNDNIIYCDNCGNKAGGKNGYPIHRLNKDISSACVGESAVLCSKCYENQIN